jgi:hypothetical protein
MSLSATEERARVRRLKAIDRLIKDEARVQRQKDEFKARLCAEGREIQLQKTAKDKRGSCLCLSCFIVLVLVVNLLIWQYILTRQN